MSSRAAARGKAATNSIRLTSRTSKAVATSRASPSRCFLFCRGSRAARSAPIAVATVAIPPTRKPPQARRVSPITERSSAQGNLMGGKLVSPAPLVPGVLFVYGWGGSQEKYLARAREIAALGCVCLTFNLRGHAETEPQHDTVTRE